jgi:hypothetical protein
MKTVWLMLLNENFQRPGLQVSFWNYKSPENIVNQWFSATQSTVKKLV